MTTSEQLEHRAEVTRAKIADSLTELRDRLTPGQMVDQALDYARDGRLGEFFQNLGRQAVNNPVPVLLVGVGVAWLAMSANRRPRPFRRSDFASGAARTSREAARSARDFTNRASQSASDMADSAAGMARTAGSTVSSWSDRAGEAASEAWRSARGTSSAVADRASAAANRASSAGSSMVHRASAAGSSLAGGVSSAASSVASAGSSVVGGVSSAASSMASAASSAYESTAYGVRRTASVLSRSAGAVANTTVSSGRSAAGFLKEEPLVLAGIGLAVGAAIGAALPITDVENRYMGPRSGALKRDAATAAEQTWEKGRDVAQDVAEKAWSEVKHAAQEEGLMPRDPNDSGQTEDQASIVPSNDRDTTTAGEISERDVARPST